MGARRQFFLSSVFVFAVCLLPSAFALPSALTMAQQTRDTSAVPVSGTGVIAGAVVTDDAAAQPIRRAIVTVSGGGMKTSRSAITDDSGTFLIDRLPEGRFSIVVKKAAYLPGAYGATRPAGPGTALALAAGQRAEITLTLARAAVLAGVIRDEQGESAPGVQVSAVRIPGSGDLTRIFATAETAVTDDRGVYRIFGLLPGEYAVAAIPRVTGSGEIGNRSTAEMDATLSALQRRSGRGGIAAQPGVAPPAIPPPPASFNYAPTYYPGATAFAGATRIRLAPGDERTGVDFVIAPVRAATIEGAVTGAGDAPANVQLAIVIDGPRVSALFSAYPVLSQRPGETTQFKYTNVAPGRYRIMARFSRSQSQNQTVAIGVGSARSGSNLPQRSADTLYGVADVDVSGADMTGVIVALQPGATLSGRVVFESESRKAPEDLSGIRVTISPPGGTYMSSSGGTVVGNTFNSVTPAQVLPDGTFTATAIAPGTYQLRVTLPAAIGQTWSLQSAVLRGQDLLDVPLEIDSGGDLPNAVLTFSDRRSELTGTLQTSSGGPAPGYIVVVFPQDRTFWTPDSRRVKSARPGTDGRFSVMDLPPGDYLIGALTDVDPDEWQTPAFLDQLVPAAIKVTISPGARVTQDIRVVR
jgi:uncharacterized protein (DUF2141 family)